MEALENKMEYRQRTENILEKSVNYQKHGLEQFISTYIQFWLLSYIV